jgi:hypothetical protein
VLAPANSTAKRLRRELYICGAHDGREGEPVATPHGRMAPGTTARQPQAEGLF